MLLAICLAALAIFLLSAAVYDLRQDLQRLELRVKELESEDEKGRPKRLWFNG